MRKAGFHSVTQEQRFLSAARAWRRGAPAAPICGARTRTGGVCAQAPIAESAAGRCLKHAGSKAQNAHAATRHRELRTGKTSPEALARAEARRARNRLIHAWRRNPSLPGATIDLGPWAADFANAASALGVDVDGLLPAVRDWLAWRFKRTRIDRDDGPGWGRTVRDGLPGKVEAAEAAMVWVRLGDPDRRTRQGRALKAALNRSGEACARSLGFGGGHAAAGTDAVAPGTPGRGPVRAVRPWAATSPDPGSKRKRPDRIRAPRKPEATLHARPGRPRTRPVDDDDLAELARVLWTAGQAARAVHDAAPDAASRLAVLRALSALQADPGDLTAHERWARCVRRFGEG